MKRAALLLLAVISCFFCLCSCSGNKNDEEALSLLRSSAKAWSGKDAYSADFCLNMQADGLEYTLLFAQGSYNVGIGENGRRLDVKMSQVSLGSTADITSVWENGVMTNVVSGTEVKSEMTEEELFSSIIYAKPFVPDDKYISSSEKLTTGAGSGCKITLKDASDVLFPLIGNDIFDLASIYKPRYDMTKVTDAEIIYTVENDVITGMKISFTLKIYDTPPYVPGSPEPDAEDYALEIRVSCNTEYGEK